MSLDVTHRTPTKPGPYAFNQGTQRVPLQAVSVRIRQALNAINSGTINILTDTGAGTNFYSDKDSAIYAKTF